MSCLIRGAAALAAALSWSLAPALAQDVTLSAADGSFTLSGDLIAFDGEYLRIDTEFGAITVDARGLTCEGPGCPFLSGGITETLLAGNENIARRLLPPLLDAFAQVQGLSLDSFPDGPAMVYDLSSPDTDAPVMRLRVVPTQSDAGLGALVAGQADLALSLAPLQDEAFHSHLLGYDAFVAVTMPDGAVTRLSTTSLGALLDGAVPAPADLGLAGEIAPEVTLHLPPGEDGTALGERLRGIGLPSLWTTAALPLPRLDPHALGVMLRSQAAGLAVLPFSESCGLELSPTEFAVKSGAYPLAQPLYAVQFRQRLPLRLRQLLAFLDGPAAAAALEGAGFIPAMPRPLDGESQSARLMGMLMQTLDGAEAAAPDDIRALADLMRDYRPLSLAFRFEPGTARLDSTALVDVAQLARLINAGDLAGASLLLVGFSDAAGDYGANQRLSLSRARGLALALGELLETAEEVDLQTAGFGPLLPVACNDSDWGRALNRRVEVWLRR